MATVIVWALALLAAPAFAGEVIIQPQTYDRWTPAAKTDPVIGATHCALIVNGQRQAYVPVDRANACHNDVGALPAGLSRVQLVAVRIDGAGVTEWPIVPPYDQSCVLVRRPSSTQFHIAWPHALTCVRGSNCKPQCP